MYIRFLALVVGLSLLAYLFHRFRPSLYGLCFGLFFLYLPLLNRIPLNIAPGVNLVTLFLIALLCLRFTAEDSPGGDHRRTFRNLLLAWLAVGSLGLLNSVLSSAAPGEALVLFKRWLDPLLFSLLALRLVRREDQHFLLSCMLIGYALVSVQGVREGLDIGYKHRIGGLIGQPNELGSFLAMYAPLVLAAALFLTKHLVRLALFGILALGVIALIYTESRACLLAFPIGVFVMLWGSGRGYYGVVGLVLVLLIAIFPSLLPEKATERFGPETVDPYVSAATGMDLDRSAAARLMIWHGALQMIGEHPLGVGFAQFKQEIPRYAQTNEYALDAHNYYILTWAEFGLIGLIVLVCLLYRLLKNGWALARYGPDRFTRSLGLGLWAGVIAALFVNCFGSRLMEIQVSTYLWVLSAMAATARDSVYEEEKEEEEEGETEPVRENAWGLRSYS